MVPNRWDVRPLADIALITSGGTPSRAKPEFWQNGTIPWIRTTEVQNCILTPDDIQEYISEEGLKGSSAKLVPSGTVLLAMIGQGKTRGQVALLKFEATINQNCAAIIFTNDQEPYFHFNFLLSQYETIRSMSNSAGQSNLNGSLVKTIKVPVPPLAEQKKIAKILSAWDKAIAITEQLIANSQRQKKALMQQLLTSKERFPEFNEDWKEVYLGDIAKITTGSSNRQDSQLSGKYTFFDRSEDIRSSDRYLFDGEAVIVPGEGQDFVPKYFWGKFDLHQRTYAIMNFPTCDGKYLFYAIHYFRAHFLSQAVGSTVKSLRLPMFQKMKLHLPTLAEQKKIASVLSNADQEIELLQQKLSHLKQEKKALMQQLLTGKRRVKTDAA